MIPYKTLPSSTEKDIFMKLSASAHIQH